LSVVLAAACGVVTALVTAHPSSGLWVGLGVVVVAGAVSQAAVTLGERRERGRVEASGAGSVAVGGSARGPITTRVRGGRVPPAVPGNQDGVIASGPGAVGIGGDAGPVSTDVTGDPGQPGGQAGSS
jgi:hypothetical protein